MPDQVEVTAVTVRVQIDAQLAIGQRAVFLRHAQVQGRHVDIDHDLGQMALLQVFLGLLQA
ncbi:hypothetical protein D9M70_558910 [compost metagenome]